MKQGSEVSVARETSTRLVLPFMRTMLFVGSFLVSLAAIQLYVLSTRTDHYFAWTIAVPLTATFLGAFYWTSAPLSLLSGFERIWVRARVGVPGVLLFLWATLATTLLHLDKFHFDSDDNFARGAAWLWLVIYAADPPLASLALWQQVRSSGIDPPRTAPLPAWYRAALGVFAVVSFGVGATMFAVPTWVAEWWPWALTSLTGRAVASWLLGLGGVLATMWWENDWIRNRIAILAVFVLGTLQLIAALRYSDDLRGGVRVGVYLFCVGVTLALAVYGLARVLSHRAAPGFHAAGHSAHVRS
jgi:hypothetical protein